MYVSLEMLETDRRMLDDAQYRIDTGKPGNIWDRDALAYLRSLHGLEYFFSYINEHLGVKTWLDVGAGTTRAAYDLSESELLQSAGIETLATVLAYHPVMDHFLGKKGTVKITPAETLREIADGSIGGITAVFSAFYSDDPNLVAASFERVLVPGGLVKMTINEGNNFPDFLRAAGLEVALSIPDPSQGLTSQVILARKPGGENVTSLQSLLQADQTTFTKQMKKLGQTTNRRGGLTTAI